MIIVNFSDGKSRKYHISEAADLAAFNCIGLAPDTITGIRFKHGSQSQVIPSPRQFRAIVYSAELIEDKGSIQGERLHVIADDVELVVALRYSERAKDINISLQRSGRLRWRPDGG